MKNFNGIDEFEQSVGQLLGYSKWHTVTQEQIDLFAAATDDHQWIHVDPEKAATGPFGGTIAHGYLTLSLIPKLLWEIYHIEGLTMGINYGTQKVRFPAPVPVESKIRASVRLVNLTRRTNGAHATLEVTVDRAGGKKPVCVAEILTVLVP